MSKKQQTADDDSECATGIRRTRVATLYSCDLLAHCYRSSAIVRRDKNDCHEKQGTIICFSCAFGVHVFGRRPRFRSAHCSRASLDLVPGRFERPPVDRRSREARQPFFCRTGNPWDRTSAQPTDNNRRQQRWTANRRDRDGTTPTG